jgi:uracil-DNA glycosylase
VLDLEVQNIEEKILHCRKCGLWKGARNAVPGEGPTNTRIVLVGQNPGAEEDKIGKPFVGRSGKFLNKILTKYNICRNNLFVTNIVKHVTPRNRKPTSEEIQACVPFLAAQLEKIKPHFVVLMGAVAWRTPRIPGVKYIETVHPSAAMRFTKMRLRFEKDFEGLAELVS